MNPKHLGQRKLFGVRCHFCKRRTMISAPTVQELVPLLLQHATEFHPDQVEHFAPETPAVRS